MGRKGGGGGTAGGGRSGRQESITFRRVVPRFLRGLMAEAAGESHEIEKSLTTREGDNHAGWERLTISDKSVPPVVGDTTMPERKDRIEVPGESNKASKSSESGAAEDSLVGLKKNTEDGSRGVAARSHLLKGGIVKKTGRATRPSKTFRTKDRQKLSFAESDSESSAECVK